MSTHETVDLSKVVVILGSFVGVNNILRLSENSRYEFQPPSGNVSTSWKGDQPREQELNPPFIALASGEHLVTVLSDITIRIRDGDRILPCTPGKPKGFPGPVTIDLGAVRLRAWPSIRSAKETRAYKQDARKFSEDILRAVPKYIPSVKRHPATAKHNVRFTETLSELATTIDTNTGDGTLSES
ncbi:hypothetical protein J3458_015210 [Metarhizium acridum]|uniref:uncharacterized protein n=1 Tax=Metarhizium acridum TaxID=92637 RepID=UPI001C6CC1BF|nr:hypothetical protein J3458_015210 [Metarhizium acridum]